MTTKYLLQDTDRHGNVRRYFRRRGSPKIRLRSDPETQPDEFRLELAAARSGDVFVPARPKVRRKHGFIYIVGFGNCVKIGYSTKVSTRITALQTSCPAPLIVYSTKHANREDEAVLHKKFAAHRLHGEWFDLAPVIVKFIADKSPL